ncbi:hypothetical protein B0H14DRAFT_3519425 [Mycena olivaceomarginata]|nr:hypothetical protein B0H14DRAFT_3519425 [Mycena olivaceomarginata]
MPLFTNHMELGNLSSRPACKRSDVDVDQRERVEATLSNLAAATYVSPSLSATNGFAPSLRFCGQGGDDDTTAWVVVGSCEKAERCAQHELEQEHGRWGSSVLNLSVRLFQQAHGPGTNFGTLGCTLATLSPPPSCASCRADTAAPIANAVAGSMRVVGPFPLHGGTFYALVSAHHSRSGGGTEADIGSAYRAVRAPSELDLEYLYSVMVVEETLPEGETGLCFFADQQIDHSPTGSCVMARVALAVDQGRLQIGEGRETSQLSKAGLFYTGAASFVVKEHDMMPDGFTITLPS